MLRRYQVQATQPERDNTRRAFRFSGWELNRRTRRLLAPQRVLTRHQLLSMARLHEAEVYDRTVDVQIHRLHPKMEPDQSRPVLIVTERGTGRRLASEVETLF